MSNASLTASALLLLSVTLSAQATLLKIVGDTSTGAHFANAAARAGDVDRDGTIDFLIGMPTALAGAGAARVYSGRDGHLLFQLDGDRSVSGQLGTAVASAGDVNGDGYPDLLASGAVHPKNGVEAGYVRLFSGKDGKLIRTHFGDGPGDLFGSAVMGVGDINGDGVPDYAAGGTENGDPVNNYGAGYAKLFSGKDGKVLHVFKGYEITSEFGHSIAAAGDVDKDGVPDILIGSLLENDRGSVRCFSGKTKKVIHNFPAQAGGDHFGVAVASGGDVDGDGYLDVLIGAVNFYSYRKGTLWVFSGRTGKKIHQIVGSTTSGMLGMSVQGVGDVNQDGYADFIGGDPMDATAGKGRGSIQLYSGKDASLLRVIYAESAGLGVGAQLDFLGDINGDGSPELLCCRPGEKYNGVKRGAVAILSLRPVAPIGSGCAAGSASAPSLDLTSPRIGKTTAMFVRGQSTTPGALLMSALPNLPTALGGNCVLHVDGASAVVLGVFRTGASGRWSTAVSVPNTTNLIGATFALQAAVNATAAPLGFDFTNGMNVFVTR